MSFRTHPVTISLRNAARALGITPVLGKFLQTDSYEAEFDRELLAAIRAGDVVWDIGANVGFYTKKFAERVGPDGRVFAFEPVPTIVSELRESVSGLNNVSVLSIALGAQAGRARMEAGADSLGATSRIVEDHRDNGIEIEICTGDEIIDSVRATRPNVIKIDTEGFELDVLAGMPDIMRDHQLRAILIEVHFGLLAKRGMSNAPHQIEQTLTRHAFAPRWIDASHIIGERD